MRNRSSAWAEPLTRPAAAAALAAGLWLAAGCGRAAHPQALAGTWEESGHTDEGTAVTGRVTYKPGGAWTATGTITETGGDGRTVSSRGTWRIESGRLEQTMTQSSDETLTPYNSSWSETIVELSQDRLTLRDAEGGAHVLRRVR